MSVVSSSPSISEFQPEALTSEQRWRRWEQRGFDNDARFRRRVHGALWNTLIMGAIVLLFWLEL